MTRLLLISACLPIAFSLFTHVTVAQETIPLIPRRLPPPGTHRPTEEQQRLHQREIARLDAIGLTHHEAYPDAAVYLEAVRRAYAHDEFYHKRVAEWIDVALNQAEERLGHLREGKTPWRNQRGLVVAGYRSRIDGSLQIYGLEIPEDLDLTQPLTLYVWLHGRGDTNTDLYFIRDREAKRSPFAFEDGITLHPFGRHCIGFKAAGEIDVLEAVEDVQKRYTIDPQRVVLSGFSMGGTTRPLTNRHFGSSTTSPITLAISSIFPSSSTVGKSTNRSRRPR